MSPFNINFKNKNAFVNAADRPAFIAEVKKRYEEEEAAKAAASPTGGSRSKFLDSLEESTVQARLRKRDREAKRTQAYNTMLNSLKERDDFDELASAGERKLSNGFFDLTSNKGKTFEEQGVMPETRDDVFHQNIYDYMTPEQRSTYNAFIGLGDRQSAKRYLNSIEEGLQQQAAQKLTETIQPGNIQNVQDFADVTRLGVRSGIGRFETGVQQLTNPDAVSKNYTEMAFEEARKDMTGGSAIVADLANTVGFMLLPSAGSMVLGAAGLAAGAGAKALSAALFGAASGGSTYNDVLREDPTGDKFDAKVYSIINGALEGSLQYALGGIGTLGKGGLSKVVGKMGVEKALAKKLANVSKAAANTPAVKRLVKSLVAGGKYAAGASDEALEEWLQAVLDPVVQNYVFGENNEVQLFGEDQMYAAMLGALGASVMNAPGVASNYTNADQIIQDALIDRAVKNNKRGKDGAKPTTEVPEVSDAEVAQFMENQDVKDLVIQIASLEQQLVNPKNRHKAGLQKNLDNAKRSLSELVNELKGKEGQETKTEKNLSPAPEDIDDSLAFLQQQLGMLEEEEQAPVTSTEEPTRDTPIPPMPRLEDQQAQTAQSAQAAEEEQRIAQLEEQSRQYQEQIKQQSDLIAQLTGENTPETEVNTGANEVAPFEEEEYTAEELVDKFRSDMEEARTMYRKNMSASDYKQYINNLTSTFRSDAEKAGMTAAEIDAVLNTQQKPATKNNTKAQQELVEDEDIDALLNEEENAEEEPGLRDIVEAVTNEEIDENQAVDELTALLNQRDMEREAAGETDQLDEYTQKKAEPEVNVTEGRIEVRFPRYADKETRQRLKDAGFKWDKNAKVWWGGENDTNRALVEELTGVKLTEDEFKPEVKRIPKEELNGEGQRNLYADGTFKRGSSNDVGSGIGLLQGVVEEQQNKESDAAAAKRREYVAKVKGVQNKSIPKTLLSEDNKSGRIKVLPDDFINEIDDTASEWEPIRKAQKEAQKNGVASSLVFYSDESYDPTSQESRESTPLGCYDMKTKTMWVNVTRGGNPYQSYKHEYYHFLIGNDENLRLYIRSKLQENGLQNKDLFDIVQKVIHPVWSKDYERIFGKQKKDSLYALYDIYADEVLAELYASDGYPDSSILTAIKNNLDININKYISVVKEAVDSYTNNSGINNMDVLSTIIKGYDNGTLGYQNYAQQEETIKRDIFQNTTANWLWVIGNKDIVSDYDEAGKYVLDLADAVSDSRLLSKNKLDINTRIAEQWDSIREDIENAKARGEKIEIAPRLEDMLLGFADAELTAGKWGGVALKQETPETLLSRAAPSTDTREHATAAKSEDTIPEIRQYLDTLSEEDRTYTQEHLNETYDKTIERINKKGGYDKAYATLMNTKNWTAPQMNEATVLISMLARGGDTKSVQAMLPKFLEQQKNLGQAVNAFKLLRRYMPDAVTAISQSIANDINVELTQEEKDNIGLCDRIIKQGFISNSVMEAATPEFREWLEEARTYVDRGQLDATTAAYAAAMSIVTAKKPSTARQKFRSLQRISLLSNPKTHFRNILGNVAEQAGAAMSRPLADLTDRFLSSVTGDRTFGSGGGEAFAKAVADSIERAVMDHALGINTVGNKFDEDTVNRKGLEQLVQQNVWDEETTKGVRKSINKVANDIDHLIGLGLSIGDAPFLIGTYESALAQIMNANGVEEATAEMMDTAWDVAFRRTFRDENAITKALTSMRNSLPFIGETIAPYVQTPANVVLTAIQYSPIGFAEALTKAFIDVGSSKSLRTQIKNNESTMKTQRQIAELVGRGALGTALMLVGSLLRAAGKITGDDDDIDSQKEKNWNKAVGRMGSSIKVGDTYIDPSSLQSLSTPIMAGAAAYESRNDDEDGTDWGGIFGAAAKASMKMGNTMLEMPVLQGVADLLGGNYDDGELLAGALSLAGNAVTQLVPFGSVLKQGAKAVDPYSRVQSEINAGPVERVAKSTVNNLRSMTPWGRKKLSERYDVLGNPIKNDASDNTAERLYNSFINPFNTSKENANDVTEEIDRLYASLQDTAVLPSAAGNSISYGGEKYKFTSADKQEYQRVEGESNAEILSKLVNSDAYDRLSDEEKAKVLSSVYDYSANKAKANYLKKQGVDYESDAKWMDSIDEIVKTGVDVGDAMVYRFELSNIKGSDDQVFYIDSLPLNSDQKDTIDEAFVDKYRSSYIDEDRDYTNADTLALSMTSDSGREKYNNRFSHSWRGVSGNYYDAMTGEEFGHFYDAYNSASKADDRVAAIKKMLMDMYGYNESYAYTMAYDFRKYYAAKYD